MVDIHQTQNKPQKQFAKRRFESVGDENPRSKYSVPSALKSLYPKQNIDPFISFCRAQTSHQTLTNTPRRGEIGCNSPYRM